MDKYRGDVEFDICVYIEVVSIILSVGDWCRG